MNTQKAISDKLKYILHSNPSLYGLTIQDYAASKLVYNIPDSAIEDAERDLTIFAARQELINKRTDISQGDWVILPDGTASRITVTHMGDSVQIGGSINGSFYISKSGYCSYSGGCGDLVKRDNLVKTCEQMEGNCWIFSGDWSGGGRGVYSTLMFNVYKLIKP